MTDLVGKFDSTPTLRQISRAVKMPKVGSRVGLKYKQQAYALRYPDRYRARYAVALAVSFGELPNPRTFLCADCPNPAREYDHYKGYEEAHWYDVQAVCRGCHVEREKKRRIHCKRGHEYTERDWVEVDGRKRHKCHACEKIRLDPDFERVDGRGMKRGTKWSETRRGRVA